MGCFVRALYGLSTMNKQIELGYLLNGSNNGHDPYLARGLWKRPARGLRRKGHLVQCPPAAPGSTVARVLPHQDPEVRARRRRSHQDPPPSAVNLAGDEQIGVGVQPSPLGLEPRGSTAPSPPAKKLPRHRVRQRRCYLPLPLTVVVVASASSSYHSRDGHH
jgi:hypothetical protein